jgi:6-phosphofructokinase
MPGLPDSTCRLLQVADMIVQRAEMGKNYGVVLIPEGLVEYMHDVSTMIAGKQNSWGWHCLPDRALIALSRRFVPASSHCRVE